MMAENEYEAELQRLETASRMAWAEYEEVRQAHKHMEIQLPALRKAGEIDRKIGKMKEDKRWSAIGFGEKE
jgi:hypothetical protein